jgi:hypothetical protein
VNLKVSPSFLKGFLRRLSKVKGKGSKAGKGIFHGPRPLSRSHMKALSKQERPPESLFVWPLEAGAKKIWWKYYNKPLLTADMTLGKPFAHLPGIRRLFVVKEQIPWGKGLTKEIERSSVLGPIAKLRDVGGPIVIGVGLEKGLETLRKNRQTDEGEKKEAQSMSPELREKVASTMLHLHQENKEHQKRAHALKLLYKQSELGCTELPRTYGELEEKLASLVNQDLVVLEKALELSGGNIKLGELGNVVDPMSQNADEQFQAAIIGNES